MPKAELRIKAADMAGIEYRENWPGEVMLYFRGRPPAEAKAKAAIEFEDRGTWRRGIIRIVGSDDLLVDLMYQ